MTNLRVIDGGDRPPPDLSARLREMADQVDAGQITGMVIACVFDDSYQFTYADSLHDCLVMAAMLQQNCLDRMRA